MNGSITTQDLIVQAKAIVIDEQYPSVSLLQRRLHIGFGPAGGLMVALEAFEVVTPQYNGLRRLTSHYETRETAERSAYVRKAQLRDIHTKIFAVQPSAILQHV